ncbi:MAG: hypothetical protein SFU53_14475 [Terrimicrobiaceae bacterium]|nr:hypothetical protein [Terrimicrobiaceae bacterium]
MNDNPEIRAKVLEWQRRHNVQDNDPALALIELLDIYYRQAVVVQAPGGDGRPGAPALSPEALSEAVRAALQPAVERLSVQLRDLERPSPLGNTDAVADAVRASLQPALERVLSQVRDLDRPSTPYFAPEALAEAVRASIQPALEKLGAQVQENQKSAALPVSSEALSEAMRASLLPSLDRVTFQIQELQRRLESTNMEESAKKIESFHDNIDYCTKKLDVVKKESDSLVVKLEKASAEIKPITRGAVVMLMLVTGVVGYVLAVILR